MHDVQRVQDVTLAKDAWRRRQLTRRAGGRRRTVCACVTIRRGVGVSGLLRVTWIPIVRYGHLELHVHDVQHHMCTRFTIRHRIGLSGVLRITWIPIKETNHQGQKTAAGQAQGLRVPSLTLPCPCQPSPLFFSPLFFSSLFFCLSFSFSLSLSLFFFLSSVIMGHTQRRNSNTCQEPGPTEMSDGMRSINICQKPFILSCLVLSYLLFRLSLSLSFTLSLSLTLSLFVSFSLFFSLSLSLSSSFSVSVSVCCWCVCLCGVVWCALSWCCGGVVWHVQNPRV